MMRLIRIFLYKVFGLKRYLKLISGFYLLLIRNGFLKKQYPELFFLEKLIKPGDVCIDIGANLGYYSYFLAKYCGKLGFVYSVEPVDLFADIFVKNTSRYKNIRLYRFALGERNDFVKMKMPIIKGVLHHGMTKISNYGDESEAIYFDVKMIIPDELFSDLDKLNFIKIDVEGYESIVVSNFKNTIKKHLPIIQAELSGKENRNCTINILKELGYEIFILENFHLRKIKKEEIENWGRDFYFLTNPKSVSS